MNLNAVEIHAGPNTNDEDGARDLDFDPQDDVGAKEPKTRDDR